MGEARSVRDAGYERLLLETSINPFEVRQTPSGKAGYYDSGTAAGSGSYVTLRTEGTANFTKASGFVALKGGRAYWDRSAGNVTYRKVGDQDYYVGRFAEDATSGATTVPVLLNENPPYDLDLLRDPFTSAIIGTQALSTMGLFSRGGLAVLIAATSEAEKVDALGVDSFANAANAIVEFAFRVPSDGAGTVVDVNVGIASATNATDADAITQHLFMHLDANNVNINFQSKDGTTTVASTDSTIDYTEGALLAQRVEVWMDMRNPADVQIYVNGSLVLDATAFNVNAAASEWKLLLHVEKTSSTDAYEFALDWLRARFAEQ